MAEDKLKIPLEIDLSELDKSLAQADKDIQESLGDSFAAVSKKAKLSIDTTLATKSVKDLDKQISELTKAKNVVLNAPKTAATESALKSIDKQLETVTKKREIKLELDTNSLKKIETGLAGIAGLAAGAFAGIVAGASAAGVGLYKLSTIASDAAESNSKLYRVFNDIEQSKVEETISNLAKNYGLATSEAEALVGSTGNVLSGIGFAGDEALEYSRKIQELAVDLTSFTNYAGGAAGASEALTKAFLGERDGLVALDLKISEVEVSNKMLELGYENLTGQAEARAKAEATLALIYEKSAKAQGDYAATSEGFANQQRLTKALLTDLAVVLGNDVLPNFSELQITINNSIREFTDYISKNDELRVAIQNLSTRLSDFIKNGIQKLMEYLPEIIDMFTKFVDTVDFLSRNLNIIVPLIAGVAASLVAVKIAILAVNAGLIAFNALTGGIVLAIGALVTAILLIVMNWDKVKEASEIALAYIVYGLKVAGNYIKTGFIASIQAINVAFYSVVEAIANGILPAVSGLINAFSVIPGMEGLKSVSAGIDSLTKSIQATTQASKDDLKATLSNYDEKNAIYKKELNEKLARIKAEKDAAIKANEEIEDSNKETTDAAKDAISSSTGTGSSGAGSGSTGASTGSSSKEVKERKQTLDEMLIEEKKYLESKIALINSSNKDEEAKLEEVNEATKESLEKRTNLVEMALMDIAASGGDFEELQITAEASVSGDLTSAVDELDQYNTKLMELGETGEDTSKKLGTLEEAFGGSMFDGFNEGLSNVLDGLEALKSGAEGATESIAAGFSKMGLNVADYISGLWSAINDLQSAQAEAQLQALEDNYDAQVESLDSKYEDELESLGEKYEAENEMLAEQLEAQDEITAEHQEKLDELEEERNELENEKREIMAEEDYLALQEAIENKEKEVAERKALLEESEADQQSILDAQTAAEEKYTADKLAAELAYEEQSYALEKEYAIKKAEIERKQAEQTKALNLFNASIALAQGIAQAVVAGMASGLPLIFVPLYTALAATTGAIQIAAIASQPLPSIPAYSRGGIVGGHSGNYEALGLTPPNNTDDTLAWVASGERVLTREQTLAYDNSNVSNSSVSTETKNYNTFNISETTNGRETAKEIVKVLGGKR